MEGLVKPGEELKDNTLDPGPLPGVKVNVCGVNGPVKVRLVGLNVPDIPEDTEGVIVPL